MSQDGGGGQMHGQTLSQLLICSDPGHQPQRALCWQPLLKEPMLALKLGTGFESPVPSLEGSWWRPSSVKGETGHGDTGIRRDAP